MQDGLQSDLARLNHRALAWALAWATTAIGHSLPPACRSIRSPENESGIRGSPQMSGTEYNLGEYDRSAVWPEWARARIVPCRHRFPFPGAHGHHWPVSLGSRRMA